MFPVHLIQPVKIRCTLFMQSHLLTVVIILLGNVRGMEKIT